MKIEQIEVKKILDSRGKDTLEVIIGSEGIFASASVPMGKSVGSYEAICLSIDEIKKKLPSFFQEVKNIDFKTSIEFDNFLIEKSGKNKEELGANFVLGLSIAFLRMLAKKEKLELYRYLKKEYLHDNEFHSLFSELADNHYGDIDQGIKKIPFNLIINTIGGGVHSFNNLDFQEYWLITKNGIEEKTFLEINLAIKNLENTLPRPLGYNDENAFSTNFNNNLEPLLYLKEFINFDLGLDIACNQIEKDMDWFEVYKNLEQIGVKYLEDPFKENEFDNFFRLRKNFNFKVIGDDLTTTNTERLKIALEKESIDGVIVKPNQIGTVYETLQFVKLAKENNLFTVFSHRSGETNDDWIIDLGVACGSEFFKIGAPLGGERVSKYNRLIDLLNQ